MIRHDSKDLTSLAHKIFMNQRKRNSLPDPQRKIKKQENKACDQSLSTLQSRDTKAPFLRLLSQKKLSTNQLDRRDSKILYGKSHQLVKRYFQANKSHFNDHMPINQSKDYDISQRVRSQESKGRRDISQTKLQIRVSLDELISQKLINEVQSPQKIIENYKQEQKRFSKKSAFDVDQLGKRSRKSFTCNVSVSQNSVEVDDKLKSKHRRNHALIVCEQSRPEIPRLIIPNNKIASQQLIGNRQSIQTNPTTESEEFEQERTTKQSTETRRIIHKHSESFSENNATSFVEFKRASQASYVAEIQKSQSLSPDQKIKHKPYLIYDLVQSQNINSKLSINFRKYISKTFQLLQNSSHYQKVRHSVESLLYPLAPQGKQYNKVIAIDLDETLVFCKTGLMRPPDHVFNIKLPGSINTISAPLYVRPYAKEFIRHLTAMCQVVIFSGSQQIYVEKVMEILDPENNIARLVFNDHCQRTVGGQITKDLTIFGRSLKEVVLIDDKVANFSLQINNGIPIIPYEGEVEDNQLQELLIFIKTHILPAWDVQKVIQTHFKLASWTKFSSGDEAVKQLYKF